MAHNIRLSGVVITKNEEQMLADCLDTLSFCDEIVVVDTGSTDSTVDIAKRMKARVVTDISSDFSHFRNTGLREAKGEWILYIDADERVSKELATSIKQVVQNETQSFDVYALQRQNFYLGNHLWPKIEKMERLFRKSALKKWTGALHETPQYTGEKGILDGYLSHYTHRDLRSMLEKTIVYSEKEALLRFEAKHPKMTWWRFPRVVVGAFFDSYIKQQGWKVGVVGLIESIYQGYSIFITYARLWELQQKKH